MEEISVEVIQFAACGGRPTRSIYGGVGRRCIH